MNIELSIIIPVYNVEKYLNRCIDSIINQSYKKYEIILINDGSTDSSLEICKQYSKKHQNIYCYNILNSGPSRARNYGLKKAKGTFVYFVDSDDYLFDNALDILVSSIKKSNADMVIFNYRVEYANGKGEIFKHVFNNKYMNNKEVIYGIIPYFYKNSAIGLASLWNKVYKKEILDKKKILFDENLYRGEDWWFNLHFFENASVILTIDDCLYNYWQGNQNSIMKKLDKNYYGEWQNSREYLINLKEQYKFDVDYNEWNIELIYNIHSLLINLCKKREDIDFIILDKFYDEIIKYNKYVNMKLKIIHKVHNFSLKCEKKVYKLISKIY